MVHACNPSTQNATAGEFQVQGQPKPHSESLSQKNKKVKNNVNDKSGTDISKRSCFASYY
jgi:hypothetical protein